MDTSFCDQPDILNTSKSDQDFRGVVVAPTPFLIGMSNFEQKEYADSDKVIYSLKTFFRHLTNGSIGQLEILFSPECMMTATGEFIRSQRDLFISKKFYRAIKGYSLAEGRKARAVNYEISSGNLDKDKLLIDFCSAFQLVSCDRDAVVDIIETATKLQFRKENPSRKLGAKRKELVDQFGYDVKSAQHCCRLLEEGIELLTTGKLTFPRPNAKHLLDIKMGKVPIESWQAEYDGLLADLDSAFSKSELPDLPDVEKINDLYTEIVMERLTKN